MFKLVERLIMPTIKRMKEIHQNSKFDFYMKILNVFWIGLGALLILIYALFLSRHFLRDLGIFFMAAAAAFKAFIQFFVK